MKKRHKRSFLAEHRWMYLLIAAALVLLLVLIYKGGRWLETRNMQSEPRGDYMQRYTYDSGIEVDGVSYRRRKNLTTILLLGVDRTGDAAAGSYRNGGQADFLRLVVLDARNKQISQLQIDRDTMATITILGVLGNRSGERVEQICLAHGFGDGQEISCELTVEAVSRLLLDARIDYYVSMNMDGVPALNDWAGGVTVTLEDDFSSQDPAMVRGATLTLTGPQAEIFVRGRRSVGEGTNEDRMRRQQKYIDLLSAQMEARLSESEDAAASLYDALEAYLTTNLSRGRMINEVWAAREYERMPLRELPGEHQIGSDGFMQFIVDQDGLQKAVLELFYEQV